MTLVALESSKYFFPMGKGEKVILLGYPLFLHRTPANIFIYADIILTSVWTVFQAASFANLAPFALAVPGAAPTPVRLVTARLLLSAQPPCCHSSAGPGSRSPFSATCEWIILASKLFPWMPLPWLRKARNFGELTVSSTFSCPKFLVKIQLIRFNRLWAEGTEGQYICAICFGKIRC